MARRLAVALAALMVFAPTLAVVLVMLDVIDVDGGHGLSQWLFFGCCSVLVLGGTVLSGLLALRSSDSPGSGRWIAAVGVVALLAFLMRFGMPFAA